MNDAIRGTSRRSQSMGAGPPLARGPSALGSHIAEVLMNTACGFSASAPDQEPDSAVTGDHSQMFQKMVGDSGPGLMFAIEFWSNAVTAGNWKIVTP